MFSKPRHGRRADPSWSTIVMAILVGSIVAWAVSSGFARRALAGLLVRAGLGAPAHGRPPVSDAGPLRMSGATTKTTLGESSFDQADLTRTNEDAASDAGPALGDIATGETDTLAGAASGPFTSHDIPEEQPLGATGRAPAVEQDLPDSVPADGTPVCPVEYPIKGNGRSGIYHPPGAFAYERTVPSICFRTAEAAERAGFRAAVH